ncbi:SRPBCC domain-containing protein [Fulvivirga sp. M361]|uniref:SRPBCC domain-containing protein n=1 Tax=Fulvivirga sp. M361 TaxID=2594266 RepID=UPI00117B4261|nr:SRPBCC domain-containing protein [Fulvivirga sp. M361]TRX61322.1 SRPBCC domain-containing protein [Fulvivirga sp. M361]
MKELYTEIQINAPASKIWSVLMDFDLYPEWNPFVISVIGRAHLRERLKVTIQTGEAKTMRFTPRVTIFKKEKEFAWLGQLLMAGLFDGHHRFEIKEIEHGQHLFIQKEQFSGLLVPLFWKKLDVGTRAGFVMMNEALKKRAEQ